MAVTRATGATVPVIYPSTATSPNPSYTGTFIPEIWSGKLIEKFYASTVLSAISNTDYEGEIRNQGDKIIIRTKPTITINDYKVDGTLALERPTASNVTLTIDNAKYFNEILDDIMDVQSDLNLLSMWADDAGEQLKLTIDTAVLASMLGQAVATNRGLTAGKSVSYDQPRCFWHAPHGRCSQRYAVVRSKSSTCSCVWVRLSTSRTFPEHGSLGCPAYLGCDDDQAVGTASGLPVW
jgi:hypothetical protein